jgi:hypothetical protein
VSVRARKEWRIDNAESTNRKHRSLHDLTKLFDLFLAPADVGICYIWLFLDLHHSDRRVDPWRKWDLNLIFLSRHTAKVPWLRSEIIVDLSVVANQ